MLTSVALAALLGACSSSAIRHVDATNTPSPTLSPSASATPSPPLDVDTPVPANASPVAAPTSVPSLASAAGLVGPLLSSVGGLPPVIYRIETSRPVVFVTVDDGWTRDPAFPTMVRDAHIPLTLFLTDAAIRTDYNYFRSLQALGAVIQDHTLTHPDLTKLSYQTQQQQICQTADRYTQVFGVRPKLFRPPYGRFNLPTLVAAASCRLGPVVLWDVTVNDGKLAFAAGHQLRAGDIILMHFRPTLRIDFAAALNAIRNAGFAVGQLATYLRYQPPPPPTYTPTPTPSPTKSPTTTPTATGSVSPTPTSTTTPSNSPSPSTSPTPTTPAPT